MHCFSSALMDCCATPLQSDSRASAGETVPSRFTSPRRVPRPCGTGRTHEGRPSGQAERGPAIARVRHARGCRPDRDANHSGEIGFRAVSPTPWFMTKPLRYLGRATRHYFVRLTKIRKMSWTLPAGGPNLDREGWGRQANATGSRRGLLAYRLPQKGDGRAGFDESSASSTIRST
jgi:hypothetical protein